MKILEEGFLKRNRNMLLIALGIFLVFFIAGAVYGYISIGDNAGQITEAMINASQSETSNPLAGLDLSSVDLFTHNLGADMLTVLGGLVLSIPSIAVIIFNAFSLGSLFGMDFTYAVVSVIPHSIIEYPASVLALSAAFIITKIEIRIIKNRNFRNTLRESKTELKDILVLIIAIAILLAIASIIEAHITPRVVFWYFNF